MMTTFDISEVFDIVDHGLFLETLLPSDLMTKTFCIFLLPLGLWLQIRFSGSSSLAYMIHLFFLRNHSSLGKLRTSIGLSYHLQVDSSSSPIPISTSIVYLSFKFIYPYKLSQKYLPGISWKIQPVLVLQNKTNTTPISSFSCALSRHTLGNLETWVTPGVLPLLFSYFQLVTKFYPLYFLLHIPPPLYVPWSQFPLVEVTITVWLRNGALTIRSLQSIPHADDGMQGTLCHSWA